MRDMNYFNSLAILKNAILRSDGKFVSVKFPRADGKIRTMIVKRASLARFANPNADPTRAMAATRRDIDHPNLVRVFEFANGGQCRTLDLDKVFQIKCNGVTMNVARGAGGVSLIPARSYG